MNNKTGTMLGYILLLLMTFTVFFDPSGAALGLHMFPSTPTGLITFAEILGNLAWLLGLFLLLIAGLLLVLLFNVELIEKLIKTSIETAIENNEPNITVNTIRDKYDNIMFPVLPWWKTSILVFSIIMSLLCIGSGFWFTGTAWLLGIITVKTYRTVAEKMATEIIDKELENVP